MDEFGDSQRFLALFRMEDSPDYVGKASGAASFLETPHLDVHPGGFGLTMGGDTASGIRAEALLLPIQDGNLNPFSILARLAPHSPVSGTLFKAYSDASGLSLEVSLLEGRPVLTLRAGDRSADLKAEAFLAEGRANLLAVSILPEGASLHVLFAVDGKPAGGGTFPFGASGWTPSGVTTIAGPGGCPGLYDEVGIWAFDSRDEPAVFPAFLFASRRDFGSAALLAEGFEGTYGSDLLLSGGASVAALEGLKLPTGAGAVFDISLEAPFKAEAVLRTGGSVVLSLTGSEGTTYIPIDAASSRVDDYTGLPLVSARVETAPSGAEAGIRLSTAGGDSIPIAGSGPWRLGLTEPDSGTVVVRLFRVLRLEQIAQE